MNNKIYDVAIIGAGPIGLFAGFQAGINDLSYILIDSLESVGGQCSTLYPEKLIYDVAGHQKITGRELINNLKDQCDKFDSDYLLGNEVVELKYSEDGIFTLVTSKGVILYSRTVLICAGGGSFNPNKPAIEDIDKFEGKSVFYFIDDVKKFHGKRVVIAGGGDSAVDWSIMLAKHDCPPEKIYFIHRRHEMRCHPSSLEELKNLESKNIDLKIPFVVDKVYGCHNSGKLEKIILKHFENNELIEELEIDYFLPFFGLKNDIGSIKNFGILLERNKVSVDYSTMQTNLTGIYAVGDICDYKGKTKLLVSGFHEAAVACNDIVRFLCEKFNRKKKAFEYSTSKFS